MNQIETNKCKLYTAVLALAGASVSTAAAGVRAYLNFKRSPPMLGAGATAATAAMVVVVESPLRKTESGLCDTWH